MAIYPFGQEVSHVVNTDLTNNTYTWSRCGRSLAIFRCRSYGVFTPEQDNDKTTRQMLNLCIPAFFSLRARLSSKTGSL